MLKKCQITLFIIIGILIIFLFVFLNYVANHMAGSESGSNIEQMDSTTFETSKVKFYVQQCLEVEVKNSLKLAGLQSGFLYNDQVAGGKYYLGKRNCKTEIFGDYVVPWYDEPSKTFYNVSYVVDSKSQLTDPCKSDDIILKDEYINCHYLGNNYPAGYGFTTLSPLCTINGSNREDLSGAQFSCRNFYSKEGSIQSLLEKHIFQNVVNCVGNLSSSNSVNFDVSVGDLSNSSINLLFGEKNVLAYLHLPLLLKIDGEEEIHSYQDDVIQDIPIRFKKVYELAYYLLNEETSNIFFNLKNAGDEPLFECKDYASGSTMTEEVNCFRDGMHVTFIKRACEYTRDNYSASECNGFDFCNAEGSNAVFVIIEDNESVTIDNEPFKFILLLGNRPSIFEKITYSGYADDDRYQIYLKKDYHTIPEKLYKNITTPFNPLDNRFDIIVDYIFFDHNDPAEARHANNLAIIPRAIDADEDFDSYRDSVMRKNYVYQGWESTAFMTSGEYSLTKKDGNITLSDFDVGTQQITIKLTDEQGSTSSESATVQVRCLDPEHGFDKDEWLYVDGYMRKGNYDFSAANIEDFDINDTNDCCNESNDFQWTEYYPSNPEKNHKCGTGKRCMVNGACEFDLATANAQFDCGQCHSAVLSAVNPYTNNPEAVECQPSNNHDSSVCNVGCCNGLCLTTATPAHILADIPLNGGEDHWDHWQKYPVCWEDSPSCITSETYILNNYPNLVGNYTYKPKNTVTLSCSYDFDLDGNPDAGHCEYGECKFGPP